MSDDKKNTGSPDRDRINVNEDYELQYWTTTLDVSAEELRAAVAEGGPTVSSGPEFPEAFKAEAEEMGAVLADLRASDAALDWFLVSPAASFGAWAPGEHTGTFRLGGDVLLTDAAGESSISGADFAHAFVDEIERPAHRRERFTVAY